MAKCTVLFWQDVPSMVEAKDDAATHKIQLSERFQELIDMMAMRRGLAGTDEYLMEWRREKPHERPGSAKQAAEALAAEIESRYDQIKADALQRPKQ